MLDEQGEEVDGMTIYRGIESTISHENWPNMGDNDVRTKFCSHFYGRSWFLFDAGKEVPVSGYRIWTANDTQNYSERNPISWTVSVSETYTEDPDDDSWIIVDERTNDRTLQAANYTPFDFDIIDTRVPAPEADVIGGNAPHPVTVLDLSGRPVLTLPEGITVAGTVPTALSQVLGALLPPGIYVVEGRKIIVR